MLRRFTTVWKDEAEQGPKAAIDLAVHKPKSIPVGEAKVVVRAVSELIEELKAHN